MAGSGKIARRIIIVGYLIILHAALVGLLADKFLVVREPVGVDPELVKDLASAPQTTPAVLPTELPTPFPEPSAASSPLPQAGQSGGLIIPVQGIRPADLLDTFSDARSDGRSHDAIDIMAPGGTPVLAAANGEIVKFWDSEAGGTTIYQISDDKRYFFYYAHLQRRADGISEKQWVHQGTVIGYVGDTGNAGPGNYHLHFSITQVIDPARYWEGPEINPYPVLKGISPLP